MDMLLDTSVVIAVLLNEPQKKYIVKQTSGKSVYCATSIVAEIGNAFSSLFKKKLLTVEEATQAFSQFLNLNLPYEEFNVESSLIIANSNNIYAYDAYLIELAQRNNSTLYTLDIKLEKLASKLGLKTLGAK